MLHLYFEYYIRRGLHSALILAVWIFFLNWRDPTMRKKLFMSTPSYRDKCGFGLFSVFRYKNFNVILTVA